MPAFGTAEYTKENDTNNAANRAAAKDINFSDEEIAATIREMDGHIRSPVPPARNPYGLALRALLWQQYYSWPDHQHNTKLLGQGNKPDGVSDKADDTPMLSTTVQLPNGEFAVTAWLPGRKSSLSKRDPNANRTNMIDPLCPRWQKKNCPFERGLPFNLESDYFSDMPRIDLGKVAKWLASMSIEVPSLAVKTNVAPFCRDGLVLASDEHGPQDLTPVLLGALNFARITGKDVIGNAWGANASLTHPHMQPIGIKLETINTVQNFSRLYPKKDIHIDTLEKTGDVEVYISTGVYGSPMVVTGRNIFSVYAATMAAKELLRDPSDPEIELDSKINVGIRYNDYSGRYTVTLSPRSRECPDEYVDGKGYLYPIEYGKRDIRKLAIACNPAGAEAMGFWPTPEIETYEKLSGPDGGVIISSMRRYVSPNTNEIHQRIQRAVSERYVDALGVSATNHFVRSRNIRLLNSFWPKRKVA